MPPPIFGTSRWAMTAQSEAANCTRVCSWRQAGKTSMMRSIAWGASLVCKRREDEVAGLGHGEGDLDRVDVAHLADQQHVGVLAKGRA